VIAASGMVTGGRVFSYLERYIELPETTVIIVGYQAEGTRGRKKLLEGATEVKIYGEYYPVAAKILEIEACLHMGIKRFTNWLSALERPEKKSILSSR
jgi:metallo-beta-lactamase family protein